MKTRPRLSKMLWVVKLLMSSCCLSTVKVFLASLDFIPAAIRPPAPSNSCGACRQIVGGRRKFFIGRAPLGKRVGAKEAQNTLSVFVRWRAGHRYISKLAKICRLIMFDIP
jgi:hypothetical protein